MIKYVCDCCGAETFKSDMFTDTVIHFLDKKVTLCPDCYDTVTKECSEAEFNIRNAVRSASRDLVSTVLRRFEALNTVELFGNDNAEVLTDAIIDRTVKNVLSRHDPVAINYDSNTHGSLQSFQSMSLSDSISLNPDYIKDVIREQITKEDWNKTLQCIFDTKVSNTHNDPDKS